MKRFAKALAAGLLCLCLLLTAVSCAAPSDEEIPAGMKIATAAGEDFRFYVPAIWNVNTAYGVSGAYYNFAVQSTVSMVKYSITDEMRTAITEAQNAGTHDGAISWFWDTQCVAAVKAQTEDGAIERYSADDSATVLGGLNAKRYHYSATVEGKLNHLIQVIGEASDAFYVLTCTLDKDLYTELLGDVEMMITNFKLSEEPYRPRDYAKYIDGTDCPHEGMQLASNEDVAYLLYVPLDWKINYDEQIYSAYHPTDRVSVSVVPYVPASEGMGLSEYFAMSQEMMQKSANGDYRLISETAGALGGCDATVYEYAFSIGGKTYQYRQYVAMSRGTIYTLTYTATPEIFEAHLGELDAIVSTFAFR